MVDGAWTTWFLRERCTSFVGWTLVSALSHRLMNVDIEQTWLRIDSIACAARSLTKSHRLRMHHTVPARALHQVPHQHQCQQRQHEGHDRRSHRHGRHGQCRQ